MKTESSLVANGLAMCSADLEQITTVTNKYKIMSKKTELTNYEKALHIASVMPRFYIGQEVKTKDGNGIIVKLEMEWNGLYISPERSKAQIWFGTGSKTTKWISDTYSLKDLNVA